MRHDLQSHGIINFSVMHMRLPPYRIILCIARDNLCSMPRYYRSTGRCRVRFLLDQFSAIFSSDSEAIPTHQGYKSIGTNYPEICKLETPNEIGRALFATPGLFLDLQALRLMRTAIRSGGSLFCTKVETQCDSPHNKAL